MRARETRVKLDRARAALVVVDVQEAFRPAVLDFEQVAAQRGRARAGARVLGLPTLVTEQYPKGLGHTVPEVAEHLDGVEPIEKVCFSAVQADGFSRALQDARRDQVLLCGIESHVCVNQTAEDLLADGVEVHVAQDAVTSRTADNRELGLHKMERVGRHGHERRDGAVRAAARGRARPSSRKCRRCQVSVDGRLRAARGRHPARRRGGRRAGPALGEVVFNTAMTGYQEAVTDPSYAGQIITFTYPADRQLRRLAAGASSPIASTRAP